MARVIRRVGIAPTYLAADGCTKVDDCRPFESSAARRRDGNHHAVPLDYFAIESGKFMAKNADSRLAGTGARRRDFVAAVNQELPVFGIRGASGEAKPSSVLVARKGRYSIWFVRC